MTTKKESSKPASPADINSRKVAKKPDKEPVPAAFMSIGDRDDVSDEDYPRKRSRLMTFREWKAAQKGKEEK